MADEVFPDSVKDFVFDLHDATRRSFIHSEQQNLYNQFRGEITAKVSTSERPHHLSCEFYKRYYFIMK
jgi:hypothetical protein